MAMTDSAAEAEHTAKIEALAQRVGPKYIIKKPERISILCEGLLFQDVKDSKLPMAANVREAFLFVDALILIYQQSKNALAVEEIPLVGQRILDDASGTSTDRPTFSIFNDHCKYTFAAQDADLHAMWVRALSDAVLDTYSFDIRFSKGFAHKIVQGTKWSAAVLGDVSLLRVCLGRCGGDTTLIDEFDADGSAPIHYAAHFGNAECVSALLEAGSQIDIADTSDFNTPLHLAVAAQHLDVCSVLVENLAPLTATNLYGLTPLTHALKAIPSIDEAARIAQWLLHKGADPNMTDADGFSPVLHAVLLSHAALVTELIRYGALANGTAGGALSEWHLLHVACGAGREVEMPEGLVRQPLSMEVVMTLLSYGANPNLSSGAKRETPLHVLLRRLKALQINASKTPEDCIELATISSAAAKLCGFGARLDVLDGSGIPVEKLADDCGCKAALAAEMKSFGAAVASPRLAAMLMKLPRVVGMHFNVTSRIGSSRHHVGSVATTMSSDTQPACMECASPFTMFNRRHHCRHCGLLVCNACSSKKAPLLASADSDDDRSKAKAALGEVLPDQRVCVCCFNLLNTLADAASEQDRRWQAEKAKAAQTAKNFADDRAALLAGATPGEPPSKDASRMAEVRSRLEETKERLAQRGEKLSRMEDRTAELSTAAKDFADVAAKLRTQQKPSWFGF